MSVGNKIKEYRELNKMTQKDIAEILEVKPGAISKYELGITEPNIDHITIFQFLGTNFLRHFNRQV